MCLLIYLNHKSVLDINKDILLHWKNYTKNIFSFSKNSVNNSILRLWDQIYVPLFTIVIAFLWIEYMRIQKWQKNKDVNYPYLFDKFVSKLKKLLNISKIK